MADTVVWAFKELSELNNELGMVVCDEALAEKLIAKGDAENPQDGARYLTPIGGSKDLSEYKTKEIRATRRRKAEAEAE